MLILSARKFPKFLPAKGSPTERLLHQDNSNDQIIAPDFTMVKRKVAALEKLDADLYVEEVSSSQFLS